METRSPHLLIAFALLIVCSGHAQSASTIAPPPPVPESVRKHLGNMGEGTGSSSHRFTNSFPESLYAPLNDPAYGTGSTAANRLSDAQMSTAFTQGLAAWRRIGNHGSCISCHSPDTFDLALIGYSDADVTRRALDHVTAAEAAQIVQLIKATRQRYSIERPMHPQTFRPRQPQTS